jgi:MFS transporter, SP family, arabinose:H+ symporter
MLGIEAVPALIYTILCLRLPESPRWLIAMRRDKAKGRAVLRALRPNDSEAELERLIDTIDQSTFSPTSASSFPFWSRQLRLPIALAFLVAFFNQLSGINAILYFAPRIFKLAGLEEQSALLQSVGIGVTNLIFTFVGLWLIDRIGRRTLLYIGSFGYIVSLGLCAWAFHSESFGFVPYCIFAFIAAHAIGQGAVIWVLISEIFPNEHRAMGQALGSFTHWFFAALLTLVFPFLVNTLAPSVVFGFFCFMMVLHLLWVKIMVIETKGVPLEEIEQKLGLRT